MRRARRGLLAQGRRRCPGSHATPVPPQLLRGEGCPLPRIRLASGVQEISRRGDCAPAVTRDGSGAHAADRAAEHRRTPMSHPTVQTADWIPRDDLAVLARCSVDTVKRDIKKHELNVREDEAGRILVNVEDFIRLGRLRSEDLIMVPRPRSPPRSSAPARPSQR